MEAFIVVAIIGGTLLAGVLFLRAVQFFLKNDAYWQAIQILQADEQLTDRIGQPMRSGFVWGYVTYDNAVGTSRLRFRLKGPKGAASIHLRSTRSLDGKWIMRELLVREFASGRTYELI